MLPILVRPGISSGPHCHLVLLLGACAGEPKAADLTGATPLHDANLAPAVVPPVLAKAATAPCAAPVDDGCIGLNGRIDARTVFIRPDFVRPTIPTAARRAMPPPTRCRAQAGAYLKSLVWHAIARPRQPYLSSRAQLPPEAVLAQPARAMTTCKADNARSMPASSTSRWVTARMRRAPIGHRRTPCSRVAAATRAASQPSATMSK